MAKDCQRLTLQQIDVVNQIFEKQIYIGNTTKICPICDKEVSISSNFVTDVVGLSLYYTVLMKTTLILWMKNNYP